MKFLPGKLSVMLVCLLVIAAAVAATLHSISRPISEASGVTQPESVGDTPTGNQTQPSAIEPQAIGPIDRSVIAGGGGTSTGGTFSESGTIGEVSASSTQSGGQFTLNGGFWNTLSPAATPTPTPTATPTPTPTASPTPTATPTPLANIVQFSSSTYSVTEACTFVTVTVNRIGDTSAGASVDYHTSDVTASERRDYITAIGTLQFAPSETTESFVVLINDDSYVEGNETFNITLSNPIGMTVGAPAVASVTIIDNPTEPSKNVIDDPRTYVCQNYHDFLNRQPDQSGWDFWTNEITSCGSDQACIDVKRVNVSAAFFLSIEFQQTGYLVERTYKAAYNDFNGSSTLGGVHTLPVPIIRFNEFLGDGQQIMRGVVVLAPGWEQQLENNKAAFFADFVQRDRFKTDFPTSMMPAAFVDQLNTRAGNVLSASERSTAINLFGGAGDTTNNTARAQALRLVAEDSDLANSEFNQAFVLMQYFGYLRRNANDPPDSDYTGYDFWLTKLNQFDGNYINAEMVKAFINSIEYRQRFGL